MHVYLAITCHLHFWQNDWGLFTYYCGNTGFYLICNLNKLGNYEFVNHSILTNITITPKWCYDVTELHFIPASKAETHMWWMGYHSGEQLLTMGTLQSWQITDKTQYSALTLPVRATRPSQSQQTADKTDNWPYVNSPHNSEELTLFPSLSASVSSVSVMLAGFRWF